MPDQRGDQARFARLAETLVEASPDALIAISPAGEILFWNNAAEIIFGYASAEAVGRSIFDLITPADQVDEMRKYIAETIETGACA